MVKEVLTLLIFLLAISCPIASYSSVQYVDISPENPVKGDVLTITIKASPNEEVPVSVSFQKTISVTDGFYEYRVRDIKIPHASNAFRVEAYGVKDLNVAVKLLFFWIAKSANANNGYASISQGNVPVGTYDVVIYGEAEDDVASVELRITATTSINTNKEGLYAYALDTSYLPEGSFTVRIGDFVKTIALPSSPNPQTAPSIPSQQPPMQSEQPAPANETEKPSETSIEEHLAEGSKPDDVMAHLMNLTPKEAAAFIENLSVDKAAEVLSTMGIDLSAEILRFSARAPQIILKMSSSIAIQIIEYMANYDVSMAAKIVSESIKIDFNTMVEHLNKIDTKLLAKIVIEILRD